MSSRDAGQITADALRVFGAFNRIHDNALWLVAEYNRNCAHRGWPSIVEVSHGRLTDRNTPDVVKEIARATGSSAELVEFPNYFAQVKDLRDLMAHAMTLEAIESDGEWALDIGYYHEDKRAWRVLNGGLLTDAMLDRTGTKLIWLLKQIDWIRIEAGLAHGPGRIAWSPAMPEAHPTF